MKKKRENQGRIKGIRKTDRKKGESGGGGVKRKTQNRGIGGLEVIMGNISERE